MKEKFQQYVMPAMMKFVSSTPIVAVKDGMVATMALTIVGSMFLLLARFPYAPVAEWFKLMDITPTLMQVAKATFDLLGLVSVFAIAYYYARQLKVEPLSAGILALVAYILLTEQSLVIEGLEKPVTGILPTSYLGAKGMVAAIIIGLAVGKIYTWFQLRGITIKMPEGVPEGVSNSFAAIIPGAVIITISAVIFGVLRANGTTFIDVIYKAIQTPLQGMTSSFWGAIAMAFFISFLWWFGVHGASIVGGILGGNLNCKHDS